MCGADRGADPSANALGFAPHYRPFLANSLEQIMIFTIRWTDLLKHLDTINRHLVIRTLAFV